MISKVQGEVAIGWEVCWRTIGGIRLHNRYARVSPSSMDNGNSFPSCGIGTAGNCSTIAWPAVYNAGTTPDIMKDGGRPKNGAAEPTSCDDKNDLPEDLVVRKVVSHR